MLHLLHSEKGGKTRLLGRNKTLLLLTSLLFIFVYGCSKWNQFSPEQVITNALEAENSISYSAVLKMAMDGIAEVDDEVIIKEWRKYEKSRVEMDVDGRLLQCVSDGNSIITYDANESKAYKLDHDSLEDFYMPPREQVEML